MNRRRMHGLLLLGACVLTLAASLVFAWKERLMIMGVPVMSERAYSSLPEYAYQDLDAYLTQNDQPAALDKKESVMYVSVNPRAHEALWHIPIRLALHHSGYKLYFAPDAAFDNLEQAVTDGHRFKLLAVAPGHHMRYEVVFTNLPVIRLDTHSGFEAYTHEGSFCLWSDFPSDEGYYSVSGSRARWHKRGGITRSAAKSSYKITLEKPSGANNSMSLLNMGEDDDWILNSMTKDDLKLREKAITTLWNEHQQTTAYKLMMSPCEYVEAVIDGEYMGLYMLQRRVDNKMLGEPYEADVIYKGDVNNDAGLPVESTLRVQYNPMNEPLEELYEYILPFYHLLATRDVKYDVLAIDEENWLDLNAFCSLFTLGDNVGSKNIYLIRHEENGEHILHFLLWDTDISMGLGWKDNDVRYEPEKVTGSSHFRREAAVRFKRDRSIRSAYEDRYTLLRSALLSDENIRRVVLECHQEIMNSGALKREQEKWGLINHGEDTLENLFDFVYTRAAWLDQTYLKKQ